MAEKNFLAEIKQITRREGKVKLWVDDGDLRKITNIPESKFDKLFPKGTTEIRMCVDTETQWVKSISQNTVKCHIFTNDDAEKERRVKCMVQEVFHENGTVTMRVYDMTEKIFRTVPKIDEKKFYKIFKTFDAEKREIVLYVDLTNNNILGMSYCPGDKIPLPTPEEIKQQEAIFNKYYHNVFV